jgi:hypothetical protein
MSSIPPRGNFDWVEDSWNKWAFKDAFNTLESTEGAWEWMKTAEPPTDEGFMWWNHPMCNKIRGHMDDGHSGVSAAICMRIMQQMAKWGWELWAAQEIVAQMKQKEKDTIW